MLEVQGVRMGYATGDEPVLRGVDLMVAPGETVVLAGANGSGKSTLASLMCGMRTLASTDALGEPGPGGATPQGTSGRILVDGFDPAAGPEQRREVRRLVGFVRQNPYDQLVSTLVDDEVAFGPRNLGLDDGQVSARVDEALAALEITHLRGRSTAALSGGEQQRVALAGVLAMHPRYLVLDEVASMLDAAARPALRSLVTRLAAERSVGIVLISHDPVEALAVDRVAVLERGRIVWDGAPSGLLVDESALWDRTFVAHPAIEALRAVLRAVPDMNERTEPRAVLEAFTERVVSGAVDAKTARRVLACLEPHADRAPARASAAAPADDGALSLEDVSFAYEPSHPVLSHVDGVFCPGEVVLLAGRSGSGKSTLACVAAGLYEPDAGAVRCAGSAVSPGGVALAFQRPEDQLFLDTVADEIAFAPRNAGCPEDEVARRVDRACALAGVDRALLDRYPFDLSGGQARRVAIASVLSLEPRALVLDEPTAGLDARGRTDAHALVREVAEEGRPVIVISHDIEEWIDAVDRVALFADGRVVREAPAREISGDAGAFASCGLEPPCAPALAASLRRALGGDAR